MNRVKTVLVCFVSVLLLGCTPLVEPLGPAPKYIGGGFPEDLKRFSSLEQLESWVDASLAENPLESLYWCGEKALALQDMAKRDGYLLNIDALTPEEYETYYLQPKSVVSGFWGPLTDRQLHMVVSASIGGSLYYIEPSTGDVWFYAYILGE